MCMRCLDELLVEEPNDVWISMESLPGASVHAILLERKGVLQA